MPEKFCPRRPSLNPTFLLRKLSVSSLVPGSCLPLPRALLRLALLSLSLGASALADSIAPTPLIPAVPPWPHLTDGQNRWNVSPLRREAEDKSRANALYASALISLENSENDTAKSLDQLRQVAALDPKFEDVQVRIANVLLQTGQIEAAFDQLTKATGADPRSAILEAMLGFTQRLRGQTDDALRLCTHALVRDPTQPIAMRVLLQIAGDQDDLSGAVLHIEDILRAGGSSVPASAWLTLAHLYVENARSEPHALSGDIVLKTLLPIYQEAVAKGQPDVESLTLLSEAYQDLGRKAEALETLQRAVDLDPANVELLLRCASLQIDLGQKAAALKNYQHAYDLNPGMNGLRDLLGRLYLDTGKYPEAIALLNQAIADQPDDPSIEADLGVAYAGAHQQAKADQWFQRAFASPLCPPEAYLKLAVFQLEKQQIKSAGKTLANAQIRFPTSAKIRFYEAIQNRYAKNYPAALACLNAMRSLASASQSDVFSPNYYLESALIMSFTDQSNLIEPLLREGLSRFPDDSDIMNELAYYWADHDMHLAEALALGKRAVQLDPGNGAIQDTCGWAYVKMGEVKDALPYLQHAAVMTNNDPVVLQHLGDAFLKLGRRREALAAWRRALEKDPGNHDLATRLAAPPAPANHAYSRSASGN
jgi:tetratricopeptide (TPR) repeat protein